MGSFFSNRTSRPLASSFILLAAVTLLPAQTPSGEIRIVVKDASGALMEAEGHLANLANGMGRRFQTDSHGAFNLPNIPYGRYRLDLSRDGFAPQTLLLDVQSAAPVFRTVTMPVGLAATRVEVVAATPLAGTGQSAMEIPAPVQTASAGDIQNSGALNLADLLNRRLDGVHLNEIQGNPFQPDVNYRGYTASPLLGTPQGLSVYMDGVRLNQPFGDVVSWDLIPRIAISETTIMPGSNPVFGLNTLGGAISIATKDGASHPGTEIQLSGGSFGRKSAEIEHGGSNSKGLNWFLSTSLLFEDGWRTASPSDVRQFFGKIGRQRGNTSLSLTIGYANNSLTGNGLQEQRLLARDWNSVYTIPDNTANRAPYLSLSARHGFSRNLSFSGTAYYRYIRTATLNGDINEDSLDQSVYQPNAADQAALAEAGYTGFPTSGANASNTPFPYWRCIAQALQGDEPGEKCNGLLNRTRSQQHNYGFTGQVTWLASSHSTHHQMTAGAAYDGSRVNFGQSSQLGYLNPDRTVTGVNAFADSVSGGDVDGKALDNRVDLHGLINTGSIYATDTISGATWNLILSGRYNRTTVDNYDRIQPLGGTGSLTGSHSFGRFNPAAGFTFSAARGLNFYLGYSEGSRAPTSIELGCADPEQPCKLPNALAGDPPLHQVVTRTWEAGIRGGSETPVLWSLGWFRAENRNDILFVASTQTGFGYFKNFGQTRRQGIQADLKGRLWRFNLGGGYTFLDATYQSPETLDGSSNSTNDDGAIEIQPGNRIPLIPRHLLKTFASLALTKKFSVDLDFVAASRSFAQGNENNLSQPVGQYYLGPGTSPGYGVANVGARYQLHPRLQFFAQVNNLLNHRYYTGAQLGPTGFTEQGNFIARPFPAVDGEYPVAHATFYAPGAPFGIWAGVRIKF